MVLIASSSSSAPVKLLGSACCTGLNSTLLAGALGVRLFDMPPKLIAHGRKHLVGEVRLSARAVSLVKRRRKHDGRYAFVDCRLDCPAAFAGIGYAPGEFGQLGILK